MKNIIILLCLTLWSASHLFAQVKPPTEPQKSNLLIDSLPVVYLNNTINIHFISPEPIAYVDISNPKIVADLPVKNILRIRYLDTLKNNSSTKEDAILTIVGASFIAQYKINYSNATEKELLKTQINILPENTKPLAITGNSMTEFELKKLAMMMLKRKPEIHAVHSMAYGLRQELNNIYAFRDYIFLDISVNNKTNLPYDIDQIRFKVEDKKITKASNVQLVEIQPAFSCYANTSFKKHYRNIYAFKKFTFPGNKVLNVEMTEKQLSGRVIVLQIDYSDLLNADTL